ncbi:Transport and Golgi organization 6 [Carabus blaptoides fortunei]
MDTFDEALRLLTNKNEIQGDFDEALSTKVITVLEYLNIEYNSIKPLVSDLANSQDDSVRWKYISVSFHVLLSLNEKETTVSITNLNNIKTLYQFIISLGILPNLIPGVGVYLNQLCKNIDKIPKEEKTIPEQYYRLKGTVTGLLLCLKLPTLKNCILVNHFNDVLCALFQLCHAPLSKPCKETTIVPGKNEFTMTECFYNELQTDRAFFQVHLDTLLSTTYAPQIMQQLMCVYGHRTSPRWLKSVVFKILIEKLQCCDGVHSLVRAVTDTQTFDTGTGWKQTDILVKILMTKPGNQMSDLYYKNICSQILALTLKCDQNGKRISFYQRIVAMCVRYLYENNTEICKEYFLNELMQMLLKYTNNSENIVGVVTDEIISSISLFYQCFIETSASTQSLPISLLNSVTLIQIHILRLVFNKSQFKETTEQIKCLLIKYLDNTDEQEKHSVFELFLFQRNDKLVMNKDSDLELTNVTTESNSLMNCECLLDLIRTENTENISISLCMYLFEISLETHKSDANTERKIVAYHLLSSLLANQKVHNHLKRNPKKIVVFITNTLNTLVTNKVHVSVNADSEQFQTLFLLVMILSVIDETLDMQSTDVDNLKMSLNEIAKECINVELKSLIHDIHFMDTLKKEPGANSEKSEYDLAMADVCDPLLPVKGHGLVTLARLIKKKDPCALEKKQYILNICQQQMKCDDSYVYLSAISVLAALGDSFPDLVLNTLADEYVNGCKDMFANDYETRIKLGEVLLRVVRSLGTTDAVIKYKSLLLNTFLTCVRDEDQWIRASSLSNLGELCRVLGYKLGTVVSEVLSCIHAVIATDQAVEARRAAVSVIRMMFVGLESETIVFLKDDILPIYRTLKQIYTNDPDDITRLQAQLALEQLNINIQDFVFPKGALEKHTTPLKY